MKKLAIAAFAAAIMGLALSLPVVAQEASAPLNPQGTLKSDAFADVPPDHWAYQAVEFLRQNGLTEGYPDRTYKGKRPMTRYEFAQVIQRMVGGLLQRISESRGVETPGVSPADLEALRNQMLTEERVREIVREMIEAAKVPPEVTKAQFEALQRLVNEFRDELSRLGTDVDALKKDLADLRGRVEAIEAELARMPRIIGSANLIGKASNKSAQVLDPATGTLRVALDHDGRPLKGNTNLLGEGGGSVPFLGYYDMDLGITAKPAAGVRLGAVLNVGNYVSSYTNPAVAGRQGTGPHGYDATGAAAVNPYKVFLNVPFRFLGSNELTIGRQGIQLTPYTLKAIDPDTYTYIPREDSGEVVFYGVNTTWRFGSAKVRAFAGTNPVDGRLLPLNVFPEFNLTSSFGIAPGGVTIPAAAASGVAKGGTPIGAVGNFAGARLTFGEPDVSPAAARELPVGTAEQMGVERPAREAAEGAGEAAEEGAEEERAEAETGIDFLFLKNVSLGVNWLMAAGRGTVGAEDARGQVFGADARFKVGPIKVEGEVGFGESTVGAAGPARARSLRDTALDVKGFVNFGLFGIADIDLGGGWRRVPLGYVVPGYWGTVGSWKNPRGIEGPVAELRVPLRWNIASFLRNIRLKASAAFYEGAQNLTTIIPAGTTDPAEENLRIDHYLAGVQFSLTSRNTVDLGWEQVFRNYVPRRSTDAPLALPTMGVAGSPLVGSRIKNTETYLNFGIGHNFTPDVAVKLLYQIVDFGKYAVDRSNQPANYRGYVATAQVGVRF